MQPKTRYWYYLFAGIPPFMGAVSNVVSKYSMGDIFPIALLFWRWVVATLAVTPFVIKGFIAEFNNIKAEKGVI